MTCALNLEQLQQLVPAAFSDAKADYLSDRYSQVRTELILKGLMDRGFVPVSAQQDRSRTGNPLAARHAIVMRHETHLNDVPVVGDTVPQLMLVNSHNGRTKLRLMGGLYRFICANGLIIGNNTVATEMVHRPLVMQQLDQEVENFGLRVAAIGDTVERWMGIELTGGQAQTFAQEAMVLRFGRDTARTAYDVNRILEATRTEDDGRSLWQVFNTVQEKATHGGFTGRNSHGTEVQSRALSGISSTVNFNRALWDLAEDFAEAA